MSGRAKAGSKALRIALQTENDGIKLYTTASEKTTHPFGKKLFLSLVEDEKSHIRMIESMAEGMGMSAALAAAREGTPRKRISTIFSECKEDLAERVSASEDELEVLKLAMEYESRGYEYYKKAARETGSSDERALFERLALEENEHYQVLESTREYLDQTGKWFLWDEQALLTGDSLGGPQAKG